MKTEIFTDSQNKVFNEALKRLESEKWFRGVCCDNFPDDNECKEDFENAVKSVMFETAMWDDPDFI